MEQRFNVLYTMDFLQRWRDTYVSKDVLIAAATELKHPPLAYAGTPFVIAIKNLLYSSPSSLEFSSLPKKMSLKCMKILSKSLQQNNSIKTLRLYACGIDNESATYLFKALEENTSIVSIDLGWNQIGTVGYRALARMLLVNTTMSKINLYENYCPDEIVLADRSREHNDEIGTLFSDVCLSRENEIELSFLAHAYGPGGRLRVW